MNNKWSERSRDIDWLIDRFSPIPGWPDNWHELYEAWIEERYRDAKQDFMDVTGIHT
jgi:hypothetical protein